MSDTTTHLGLPYLLAAQAQKHVTHNEALRLLDEHQPDILFLDIEMPGATGIDVARQVDRCQHPAVAEAGHDNSLACHTVTRRGRHGTNLGTRSITSWYPARRSRLATTVN